MYDLDGDGLIGDKVRHVPLPAYHH